MVRQIAERFGLGESVPLERAVDVVWTLTSNETADRLVRRCGWSFDDYQSWLAGALIDGLRALEH